MDSYFKFVIYLNLCNMLNFNTDLSQLMETLKF